MKRAVAAKPTPSVGKATSPGTEAPDASPANVDDKPLGAPDSKAVALPHEKDESPDRVAGKLRRHIVQAKLDVDSGQVDTDNYSRVREWADKQSG